MKNNENHLTWYRHTSSLRRASSGYVFDFGNDIVVMDHGPGAHQRLLEAGYQATDVTHFLATHYHYDHHGLPEACADPLGSWGRRSQTSESLWSRPVTEDKRDRFIDLLVLLR